MNNLAGTVSFTGVTGTGKTTLIRKVTEKLRETGEDVICMSEGVVLNESDVPLDFIDCTKHNWKVDIKLFIWVLVFIIKYFQFFIYSLYLISIAKCETAHKLAIYRSFHRKCGLYVYFRRRRYRDKLILLDEDLFHSVHNILVHPGYEYKRAQIIRFIMLIPLPKKIVMLNSTIDNIISKLLSRGDISPRVNTIEQLNSFVENACNVFSIIKNIPRIKNILMTYHCESDVFDMVKKLKLSLL